MSNDDDKGQLARFIVVHSSDPRVRERRDFGWHLIDTKTGACIGSDGGEPLLVRDWAVRSALERDAEEAAIERAEEWREDQWREDMTRHRWEP